MTFRKIDVHEVGTNLRQARESTEAVRSLQEELEDVLAKFNDNSKRYAAGELSREEFSDMTLSKEEDVKSLNDKVKNNLSVILGSIDTIGKIASAQEPVDEAAEGAPAHRAKKKAVKKAVHHRAKTRHKKK